jgi:hypothetical protein
MNRRPILGLTLTILLAATLASRGLMTPDAVVCSATAADSALICVAPAFTAALSTAR